MSKFVCKVNGSLPGKTIINGKPYGAVCGCISTDEHSCCAEHPEKCEHSSKAVYNVGNRVLVDLGGHYIRHVEHMACEGLHDRPDIAAELAYRDQLLEYAREYLSKADGIGPAGLGLVRAIDEVLDDA